MHAAGGGAAVWVAGGEDRTQTNAHAECADVFDLRNRLSVCTHFHELSGYARTVWRRHGFMTKWRMLFLLGGLPAALAAFISMGVEESPAWKRGRARSAGESYRALLKSLPLFGFVVFLMFGFCSFSHGTQDLYPTFLKHDRGLDVQVTAVVSIVGVVGAFAGGMCFGALSERLGRRRAIALAALLAVPVIPLWVWSHTAAMLAAGGF